MALIFFSPQFCEMWANVLWCLGYYGVNCLWLSAADINVVAEPEVNMFFSYVRYELKQH